MGYAFSGKWSSNTGPTAPLGGPGRTVSSLLEDERDYSQVALYHPEKLILGVPYYGCKWKTRSAEPGTSVQEFVNYPRLRDALPQAARWGARWDARSQTAWYRYRDGEDWVQVWYDDVESLRLKYELAMDKNLRGFGIWALGYEGKQTEPWQLIEKLTGDAPPHSSQPKQLSPTILRSLFPTPTPSMPALKCAITCRDLDACRSTSTMCSAVVSTLESANRKCGACCMALGRRNRTGRNRFRHLYDAIPLLQ